MELLLVRHLWGIDEPWEVAFPRIREAGYTAVEAPIPPPPEDNRFRALLREHGLSYLPMVFTRGSTVSEHIESFRSQMAEACAFDPLRITSHSGVDAWNLDDASIFFAEAIRIERSTDVQVAHETHRSRILYNPWSTRDLIARFPELHLCCDFSHWVCVCERLLEDSETIIEAAAKHCIHLHARVGYEQGPQVPDPQAPEYRRHRDAHERWWETIWQAQAERGMRSSTLTPEFGPPPYLHTLPYTDAPVVNLWEICNRQARRQAERFAQWKNNKIPMT